MFLKIITLSSAAVFIATASFAASSKTCTHLHSPADVHSKHEHAQAHHGGYVKPGAAVAMTHDYDGQTASGEFETATLTISHIYNDGFLAIEVLPTEDLQIFANAPIEKIQLQTGSTLNLPIQFSGRINGTYSIAVETIYESVNGQQSRRVLSLPITIGPKLSRKTRPTAPITSKSAPKGYISLPATEVIR